MKGILIMISVIALSSCLKNSAVELATVEELNCSDTISFNSEIMDEIFTPSCNTAGCHDISGAGGYNLTAYNSVNSNATLILNAIEHKAGASAMPVGASKLNDSLIVKFKCWMQQGQLDN